MVEFPFCWWLNYIGDDLFEIKVKDYRERLVLFCFVLYGIFYDWIITIYDSL